MTFWKWDEFFIWKQSQYWVEITLPDQKLKNIFWPVHFVPFQLRQFLSLKSVSVSNFSNFAGLQLETNFSLNKINTAPVAGYSMIVCPNINWPLLQYLASITLVCLLLLSLEPTVYSRSPFVKSWSFLFMLGFLCLEVGLVHNTHAHISFIDTHS